MAIPNRLRNKEINFCLVEKPIKGNSSSGKKPFQKGWQNKEMKWDDKELTEWIGQGGNYGVVGGGTSNLMILDFDNKMVQDAVASKLPETFTVKTGSGLLHKYFFTDEEKGFRVKDKELNTLVDVQGKSTQVVGPGCKHYTGNNYIIENNSPIATIPFSEIKAILDPYNEDPKKNIKEVPKTEQKELKNYEGDEFYNNLLSSVSFESLLSEFGVDTSKNPTNCSFHSSKGGKCLGFETERAHCFHCDGSWNKISWIKENKNCTAKEAIEWLAEREGKQEELDNSRREWKNAKVEDDIKELNALMNKNKPEGEEEITFQEEEINWIDETLSWKELKEHARAIIKGRGKYFLVLSNNDEIKGKPQLIHTTQKKVTLIKKTQKEEGKKGEEEIIEKIKFLDEGVEKKRDGIVIDSWSKDLWTYKVVSDNKEYYCLSEEELPLQGCIIKGMIMEVSDLAEMNNSLKIKTLSNIFFVKSFEPSVKIISKEEIINFTKERKITEQVWTDFLDFHPLGTRNRFPYFSNLLRSAHLLSGKIYGWPLHVAVMGPAGTRKSMGYIETIAYKFEEYPKIVEGANSRVKTLSPSFKEKPANIGYLARAERMGWIDELGKMIEFETNKHTELVRNVLGELNFLLDNKRRTVGSGNDNECVVQANSKFLMVLNPVQKKQNVGDHVGTIDPTTMSRIFWWVQSEDEQNFVTSSDGIENSSIGNEGGSDNGKTYASCAPHTKTIMEKNSDIKIKIKEKRCVCVCGGGFQESVITREEYLTLYDTINSFTCKIEQEHIEKLNATVLALSRGEMREIWKPRGPHHIELLVDGICKHRCLFEDYDSSFEVKQKDYDLCEKLLIEMVNRWNTNLTINKRSGYL